MATPFRTRSVLTLGLGLMGLALAPDAQTIVNNTNRVGGVELPGSSTKGLWAYETGGKQYCLQTRGSSGMAIIDMTDTSNPQVVQNISGNFRKVQVWQNYAYATTDQGPTVIVDMTNPETATVAGTMTTGAHTLRVDETNGRLYLNRSSSMRIYDLTADPTNPNLIGTHFVAAHDCRPAGNICYVNGFSLPRTRILDVSNPDVTVLLGEIPEGNHSSDVYYAPDGGTYLLLCDEATGGHVNIYDVTDPTDPQYVSDYQTADTGASVHNVEIVGNYAYVAYYQDQLRVLDLRDPSNPQEVGVWDNNPNNTGSTYSDAWEAIPFHDAVYVGQMTTTTAAPQGTHAIDFYHGFGSGSVGTDGVPQPWWSFGPPFPGNTRFALELANARPNATAWLILGASNSSWAGNSLPMTMDVIGAPNASLYVSPDFLTSTTTDAQGNASVPFPVPPGVPYQTIYAQWAVVDPGAPNPGGWAFSRAGELVLY